MINPFPHKETQLWQNSLNRSTHRGISFSQLYGESKSRMAQQYFKKCLYLALLNADLDFNTTISSYCIYNRSSDDYQNLNLNCSLLFLLNSTGTNFFVSCIELFKKDIDRKDNFARCCLKINKFISLHLVFALQFNWTHIIRAFKTSQKELRFGLVFFKKRFRNTVYFSTWRLALWKW